MHDGFGEAGRAGGVEYVERMGGWELLEPQRFGLGAAGRVSIIPSEYSDCAPIL